MHIATNRLQLSTWPTKDKPQILTPFSFQV